jgi:hypothetical protein
MAIWQFKLDLLPEEAVLERFGNLPETIPDALVENIPWWKGSQPGERLSAVVNSLLLPTESWSESVLIWGDEDSDVVKAIYTSATREELEWLAIRIDTRKVLKEFVENVANLAKALHCVFLTAENAVLEPKACTLWEALNKSTAKGFVDDPQKALRSIEGQVIEVDSPREAYGDNEAAE